MSRCAHWYNTPKGGTCLKEILHVCSGEDGAKCYEAPDGSWAFAWGLNRILEEYGMIARLAGPCLDPAEKGFRDEHLEELHEAVFAFEERIREIAREETERMLGD